MCALQVLVGLLFLINGSEFAFFLASEINRPEMQAETRTHARTHSHPISSPPPPPARAARAHARTHEHAQTDTDTNTDTRWRPRRRRTPVAEGRALGETEPGLNDSDKPSSTVARGSGGGGAARSRAPRGAEKAAGSVRERRR